METLGKPIGQQHTVPSAGFDQGEHGAGVGLAGGHGQVNSHNTQAGMAAAQQGGIPTGHPIADKFTSQGQGQNSVAGAYAGGATDDGLTGQSNAHRTGAGVGYDGENLPTSRASAAAGAGGGSYATSGDAVSGAYEGGAVRDALTGESHAHRTGAGVGPLGENLGQGHQGHHHGHHGHHHATDAALAGTAAGAVAGAGAAAGTGVGPSGGAGGHYNVPSTTSTSTGTGNASGVGAGGLATGTGASGAGVLDAQRAGAQAHRDGQGLSSGSLGAGAAGAGVGAGALGAGAAGASRKDASTSAPQADNERGAPVVDPKELDNGGRHGLIYDKSTGKYVHRHEVEEGK